jgi:hypothetical protein
VDQVIQGVLEALRPKWLSGKSLQPSDLVWCDEHTLCGGRGYPLPS